ncbi:ras-related GTP-binding protein D-like isoform X4 [Tachypleus tridentatus]|uniref:ras-related GTP-binding protein D-like isoform X4 n=1 Tax=Tachypleus tridentatus TaxID=6853 RepID=UPI003FD0451E
MLYEEKGICQEDYIVGSFPRNYGCGPDNDIETEDVNSIQKHRIFLMGLRRSGKSSIYKVVFHKMSPSKTLYLESTSKIVKENIFKHSFIQFQIWDFPGEIDIFDPTFDSETIFGSCGAIVFVIDAQDDYLEALNILHRTIFQAYKINCKIHFEVFIHKTDGLLYDHKIETQRDIHKRANEDLEDSGIKSVRLSFHLTSIYDHSIFEALSRVVQKLIPQVPALENLLDVLISNSVIEKAFLLDIASKIYIATDSSPLDMKSYELCCDMIDVVLDISYIYGLPEDNDMTVFDEQSCSIIKLSCSTVLYLQEMNDCLALICIFREENFDNKGNILRRQELSM